MHYRFICVCPPGFLNTSKHTLFLIDPFGPPEEEMSDNDPIRCMQEEEVMVAWLKDERDHYDLPSQEYNVVRNLPQWHNQVAKKDTINCLLFCLVMMEFVSLYGRFPTWKDVDGYGEMPLVRQYILHRLLNVTTTSTDLTCFLEDTLFHD